MLKSNLRLICKQYLPLIIDHISSFCLLDGDETPPLSEHFIPYNLTIDEFTRLQSILLQKIDSSETILNITLDVFFSIFHILLI
ncbi:unnamed protein product [Rotaria sordida]|uniref:Uncharacterized protein n=1 Tax=Rotaria sordida TaxID=392033 RepID=A0A820IB15_9BILA|nr:unnamed protein product [Rotaria sordida]